MGTEYNNGYNNVHDNAMESKKIEVPDSHR